MAKSREELLIFLIMEVLGLIFSVATRAMEIGLFTPEEADKIDAKYQEIRKAFYAAKKPEE